MSVSSPHHPDATSQLPRLIRFRVGEATAVRRSAETDDGGKTRTIFVLRKNNQESIHVRVTDLGGTSLIDLRVFAASPRKGFEPVPTRSGICLPRAQLRALIQALESAEAAQ